ncbi:LysR family transcriptional regulator [Tissierella pigra]|uniref:LysR family transcriptional regulator n=1 Tax=Tissierella pigra TaxID=2607614 RepID=A0A6N7XMF9_9FIRM|nr:LysR family transcriptional regulator [Tissierella pigra]MBU5428116.1 LysR family transcriptional regulator [Tissierella pigra]MSU01972.1 LysR family transcriptional regulator [Tissierella pigra]
MITILQINYFIELVKNMNFSKTAEILYISQPALSKQISNLEKELGFLLFDRSGKNIKLSAEGKLIYDFFIESRDEYKKIVNKIIQSNGNDITKLNIAFLSGWDISRYIAEADELLAEEHSDIMIHLESGDFNDLSSKLNDGSVDIVLSLPNNFDNTKNINLKHLTDIQRFIVYSKSNHLNNKNNLSISDFKNEDFFIFIDSLERTSLEILLDIYNCLGFEPKIIQVSNIESMMLNVEAGRGVAIFDEWHRVINNNMLKVIDIGSEHKVFAGWRKDNKNVAIKLFLDKFIYVINNKK